MPVIQTQKRTGLEGVRDYLITAEPIILIRSNETERVLRALKSLIGERDDQISGFLFRWSLTTGAVAEKIAEGQGDHEVILYEPIGELGQGVRIGTQELWPRNNMQQSGAPDNADWLRTFGPVQTGVPRKGTGAPPFGAFEFAMDCKSTALVVALGLSDKSGGQQFIERPEVMDYLRSAHRRLGGKPSAVIMISNDMQVPPEISKLVAEVEWPLPTVEEHAEAVADTLRDVVIRNGLAVDYGEASDEDEFVRMQAERLMGLTKTEAGRALRQQVGDLMGMSATREALADLDGYRTSIIGEHPALDMWTHLNTFDDVYGLDVLKADIEEESIVANNTEAREFGARLSRGCLLVGPPGTGKSSIAKAIAYAMQRPLVRMDMNALYSTGGSLVGAIEREVLDVQRRIASLIHGGVGPVVWLDEINTVFGTSGANRTTDDGGVYSRVYGSFLFWMEEVASRGAYFVATSNYGNIRPAMMRRLGGVYMVDLPAFSERLGILTHYVNWHGRNPATLDLDYCASLKPGISGAELEIAVQLAINAAAVERVKTGDDTIDLTTEHLIAAIGRTIPVAYSQAEEVQEMRAWGENRARYASAERSDFDPTRIDHYAVEDEGVAITPFSSGAADSGDRWGRIDFHGGDDDE